MSIKEEYIEKVEQYLRGNLTEQEKTEFERELANDQLLRETLAFMSDIQSSVEISTIKDLKGRLQNEDKKNKGGFRWLAIAASIAIIATVAFIINNQARNADPQDIYNEFYSPYPNVVAPNNRSANPENINAYILYEQGNYDRAIQILSEKNQTDTVHFYMGQTLLALNKESEALNQFMKIGSVSSFSSAARWYETLIYLKLNQTDRAVEMLDEIINTDNDYSAKAKEVKDQL